MLLNVLFWIVQNFRPNSRPLNSGLEKNALHIWIQNDLSFSKLFKIWKSVKKWQLNNPRVKLSSRDTCSSKYLCKLKRYSRLLLSILLAPRESYIGLNLSMRKLYWKCGERPYTCALWSLEKASHLLTISFI